jgi:hypothetical protein
LSEALLSVGARLRLARVNAIGRVANRASSPGRAPIPDNCEDWPFLAYLSLPDYESDASGYPSIAAKHQVDPGRPKEE